MGQSVATALVGTSMRAAAIAMTTLSFQEYGDRSSMVDLLVTRK
jgi:hypothetical protein